MAALEIVRRNFQNSFSVFFSGYLQNQGTEEKAWNKLALEFCKLNKTYLREEYNLLSRGIKVKYVSNPRTLVGIIREFIEIEEIGMQFCEIK